MIEDLSVWQFAAAVAQPALLLASPSFLEELAERLRVAGIQDAVARRDSGRIFNWMMTLVSFQGISDAAALAFDAKHGGVGHAAIAAALASHPSCPRLHCYWSFGGCGYHKGSGKCAEPRHRPWCPLPRHVLRKGGLNVAAYSLFLFLRDVCDDDLVGWIDGRLAAADRGGNIADRASSMRTALLDPLVNITGTGQKLWSMILAELLLAGDPARERWVTTGASMIAVDTLVHNFLHRTGTLRRLGAEHPYGWRCYGQDGCAEVIAGLARRIDARAYNPYFPAVFPRFVQHAIWLFCAASGRDICNGNRIADSNRCDQRFCPVHPNCDRVRLRA